MKKLKFVLLAMCIGLVANATEELKQFDRIAVTLVDGTYYEIPINSSSYIYSHVLGTGVNATQIVYIKGDNCEYKFDRNEIKTLRCVEYYSGIKDIIVENREKLRYEDDKFKFDSSLIGEDLFVYDISGRLIHYETITEKSTITLKHLPVGVYVAKVKNESIKVAVR
jgi:hypothetical protein